ncbi:hypothetical protein [Verrucomicrobium spinosum]|uniref:hypothetical protein n=1 Tax=Verrucomicrobium spinosum TaxID=2736 RepID=UPI00017460E7|nr:hypothetical protein [Verrucomicrobium spinosum]
MAVRLSANYSKKLGLPQYSSHSFSASVEVELTDLNQVESECQKLYQLLQQSVDQEIQQVGFVPDPKQYGQKGSSSGLRNGFHRNGNNQNGRQFRVHNGSQDRWACTDGQRGFILRITNENNLDKQEIEALAHRLYGLGVKHLNKMQASQLIEELLTLAGKPRQSRWHQQPQQQAA